MGLLHPRVSTLHRQNRERMDFRPEFHNSPLQGSPQGSSYSPQKFMSNRQAQQNLVQYTDPRPPQMTLQHPVSNERAAVQCYRCLMFGHYASSCPNVPAGTIAPRSHQNERRNRNIVCHYCGIPGHVQRKCRKRLRAQGFVSNRAQSGQNWRSQSQVP